MYKAEKQLLMEIMKTAFGTGNTEKLKKLSGICNYDKLEKLTRQTGLEGFIYSVCRREDIVGLFPEKYMIQLHKKAGLAAIKNSFIRDNALMIIKELETQGIEYIVVKGIEILERLYNDDMLRAVSDLDLLVKKEQFFKAADILYGEGYINPLKEGVLREYDPSSRCIHEIPDELAFLKDARPYPFTIDLHSDLGGFKKGSLLRELYPAYRHDWYGNIHVLEICGTKVYCLNNEMEFLFMVYHFSVHHSFMSLKWLLDICCMLVKYNEEMDWQKIQDRKSVV